MLYMLRITGDGKAAVLLNNQDAGVLSEGMLEQTVCGGRILVQLFPLESGLLPVSALLELKAPPAMVGAADAVRLYVLSEDQLHLKVTFPKQEKLTPSLPYILRRSSADPGGLTATVYFDRTFNFAIERNGMILLGGAFEKALTDGRITRHGGILLIEGICAGEKEFFAVDAGAEPRVLLHHAAETVRLQEDVLEYSLPMGQLTAEIRYSVKEKRQISRSLRFRDEKKHLLSGLLEAVRMGEEEFAMSLVAPGLKKDASFSDFQAFFGEYAEVIPSRNAEEISLAYRVSENVFSLRRLRASVKYEQIWNIEEI